MTEKDTRLKCIKQSLQDAINMIKQDSAWLKPTSQNYLVDAIENLKNEIERQYQQKR